jgi:hypothetical protein
MLEQETNTIACSEKLIEPRLVNFALTHLLSYRKFVLLNSTNSLHTETHPPQTVGGARFLRQQLLRPCADVATIAARQVSLEASCGNSFFKIHFLVTVYLFFYFLLDCIGCRQLPS